MAQQKGCLSSHRLLSSDRSANSSDFNLNRSLQRVAGLKQAYRSRFMKWFKTRSNHYPTQEQRLLLHAALFQGEEAVNRWQQWRDAVDIETLDSESYHLLPLLCQNLVAHQVEDTHMARLKGVYRRHWYANQLLLKQAKSVITSLRENQIEAIVLQDAALATTYYQDFADRPMYSLEFLIHPDEVVSTIQILQSLGWTLSSTEPLETLITRSVLALTNQAQQQLYLHTHIFWAIPQNYTDEQVWKSRIPGQVSEVPISILDPTDQLLFICLRSKHEGQQHRIHWLVDAFMLLKPSAKIDWGRLVAQAQRYQLVLPLKNLLILLQKVLNVVIPNWVIPNLDLIPISQFELLEHQIFLNHKKLILKANLLRLYYRFVHLKNQAIQLLSIGSLVHRAQ